MKSLQNSDITRRQFLRGIGVTAGGALIATGFTQTGFSKTENDPILEKIRPFVEQRIIAGAVMLVASKEKVIYENAIGFADISANKPMKTDAVFWIASQSKPITASAFMTLFDEGKIQLDDAVEKYLPEFKNQMVYSEATNDSVVLRKPSHPITIREILSHTSGLPFSSLVESPTLDRLPLDIAVKSYAMSNLRFQPDTKYSYSNAGINTAARIIEVVTGTDYVAYLNDRILKPLGMKETTFFPDEHLVKRLAKAYEPNKEKNGYKEIRITQLTYPLTDRIHRYPMPAGGLFSTARDTAKFCQLILNKGVHSGKRLLSEQAVNLMTARQTPQAVNESYGLGFMVGDGWCGHGGAYATNMQIDFKNNLIFVWMVQNNGFIKNGAEAYETFKRTAIEVYKNAM
ncbi:MAG: serine hydrolase domain-containing protein [Verrucomicrobiia bacterium]